MLVNTKNVTLKEMASFCDVTETGLQKMLNNDDFKSSTLIKIAEFLNVPVEQLFREPFRKAEKSKIFKNGRSRVIIQIELDEDDNLKLNMGSDLLYLIDK